MVEAEQNVVDEFLIMMTKIKNNVQAYTKAIPDSEAYTQYRKSFVNILYQLDDEIMCEGKLANIFLTYKAIIEDLNKNQSAEAKKVIEIIDKSHKNVITQHENALKFLNMDLQECTVSFHGIKNVLLKRTKSLICHQV